MHLVFFFFFFFFFSFFYSVYFVFHPLSGMVGRLDGRRGLSDGLERLHCFDEASCRFSDVFLFFFFYLPCLLVISLDRGWSHLENSRWFTRFLWMAGSAFDTSFLCADLD
ncbi:hypothetical protein V8C44DRAFT_320340 [Trichoderma aethiopicum]